MNRQSFILHPKIRLMQETAEKSLGKNFATMMSPFFVFSFATLLFLSSGCDSKQGEANGIADTSSTATTEVLTVHSDISSFLTQEADLTSFRKVMKNIHSLETFTQVKSKQIILFAPSNQAFEKLGDAEKEKLLDSDLVSTRLEMFKNSLVLHNKKEGDWNGTGQTYGGKSINAKFDSGEISSQNNNARILKKIHLKGGHLVYIVDNIFAKPFNLS
jgi:uncharacterized surface protein with fasciclin (FAS1) repeats